MGQIWELFRSDFSIFWRRSKCTETDLKSPRFVPFAANQIQFGINPDLIFFSDTDISVNSIFSDSHIPQSVAVLSEGKLVETLTLPEMPGAAITQTYELGPSGDRIFMVSRVYS